MNETKSLILLRKIWTKCRKKLENSNDTEDKIYCNGHGNKKYYEYKNIGT